MYPIVVDLTGAWQLQMTEHDAGDPERLSACEQGWLEAEVPGDVHQTLMQAGLLPDIHIGGNARQAQWVTQKDWWFRKVFWVPEELGRHTELQMDGLDVYAKIWLNGAFLGSSENAFLPWHRRVDTVLKPGEENVLLVRLESLAARLGRTHFTGDHNDWGRRGALRTKVRKPQFSFGWDWAPVLPSVGIWRQVRVASWPGHHIADVGVRTKTSGQVDFFFTMTGQVKDGLLQVKVTGPGYQSTQTIPLRGARHYCTFQIDTPALWWPRGYGDPQLYHYEVRYLAGGVLCDSRSGRFGIREVQVFEEPYPAGMSFGLVVNGEKVFIKGANWVPVELFPGTAGDTKYLKTLEKAREANFNMLRVWGGGIYESDLFYDWCDENGMLVWQDFMFAGAVYDVSNPVLRRSIIAEAEHQVKRLRNHPCIAIWCGTNEDGKSWSYRDEQRDDLGMAEGVREPTRGQLDDELFSMILRGTVSRFTREPYVESSPQSWDDYGNHPASGNSHLSCHKYCFDKSAERFREHFATVVAFDSEFCIQGPPRRSSMQRFLPEEHHWPPDAIWDFHIYEGHGRLHHELHIKYAEDLFGPVDSLADYCKHGAAVHAEFMRAEYEAARSQKWSCGGTMVWMLNDCWPTANWSLFDYYGVPKPAFYAAKRACAPVLPLIFESHGAVRFLISNDTLIAYSGCVLIGQETVAGEVLWQKELAVQVPVNATALVHTLPRRELASDPSAFVFADLMLGEATFDRVTYFPDLWKQVPWPEPRVTAQLVAERQEPGGYVSTVCVSTDLYARFCHLDVLPFDEHELSDNFFDLSAGRSRLVEIRSRRPVTANALTVGHWLTEWR